MRSRLCVECICALTVIFLLFGPYLASILRGRNALWFLWQPHDAFVLLGCMGVLAAGCMAVREVIRRCRWPFALALVDHAFVVALGSGLLTNLWFHTNRPAGYHISQYGMEIQTAWLVMFGLVGYSLASARFKLVMRARQLCQILSPVVLIVTWQLVRLPTLAEPMDPLVPAVQRNLRPVVEDGKPQRPVYLLIFDEWSYTRTYRDGQLRPEFRHLAELSRRATTFHNAHSPGTDTAMSIPAICRQTSDRPETHGLKAGFVANDKWMPCEQYPSIFTAAGCSDYRKIMVHWGFCLSLWLQNELDVARAYPCYPRASGPLGQALLHVYNSAFYWTDPWSALAYERLQTRVKDASALDRYAHVHQDLMAILRDEPARTFAIVHYPMPHSPYVLNPDGGYRGPDPKGWEKENLDGYERNLACLDRVIGEVVAALKSSGQLDDCVLILTSDHSWRNDPAMVKRTDEILTHVPLIVKMPGQQEASSVDADFRTCRLGELIARGLRESRNARPTLAARIQRPDSQ